MKTITKGQIAYDDLSHGIGTFNRATSTGGTSTLTSVPIFIGSGAPVVSAAVGCLYLRTDGGASTTLYVKESGTGTSGWVGK